MKKAILSLGVTAAFTIYALLGQSRGSAALTSTPITSSEAASTTQVAMATTSKAPAPVIRHRHSDDDSGGEIGESGESGGLASQTSQPQTVQAPTPVPTPTPAPAPTPAPTPAPANAGKFKNGTYTGSAADAYFGTVQVQAVIQSGALAQVNILQYPNDNGTSRQIASMSLPTLKSEAIQSQSAQVDAVSGATQTSDAFIQSLGSALAQAAN